jgi:hypothetical protein
MSASRWRSSSPAFASAAAMPASAGSLASRARRRARCSAAAPPTRRAATESSILGFHSARRATISSSVAGSAGTLAGGPSRSSPYNDSASPGTSSSRREAAFTARPQALDMVSTVARGHPVSRAAKSRSRKRSWSMSAGVPPSSSMGTRSARRRRYSGSPRSSGCSRADRRTTMRTRSIAAGAKPSAGSLTSNSGPATSAARRAATSPLDRRQTPTISSGCASPAGRTSNTTSGPRPPRPSPSRASSVRKRTASNAPSSLVIRRSPRGSRRRPRSRSNTATSNPRPGEPSSNSTRPASVTSEASTAPVSSNAPFASSSASMRSASGASTARACAERGPVGTPSTRRSRTTDSAVASPYVALARSRISPPRAASRPSGPAPSASSRPATRRKISASWSAATAGPWSAGPSGEVMRFTGWSSGEGVAGAWGARRQSFACLPRSTLGT